MDRRCFLKKSCAAGVTLAATNAGAQTAPPDTSLQPDPLASSQAPMSPHIRKIVQQLKLVSAYNRDSVMGKAVEEMSRFIALASHGSITIKVFHANELVKPFECMDAVKSGKADWGYGTPSYWKKHNPAFDFITGMPFGLTAGEQNAWLYHADGIEICDEIYNAQGTKFLPMGNTGTQMGGWFKKEVVTSHDLRGLRFRIAGLGGEIMDSLGAKTVRMSGDEIMPGLLFGHLDGAEYICPSADLAKGFYQAAKYYYYPGWHEPGTVHDGFINLKIWEKLPRDKKRLLRYATAHMSQQVRSKFQALNNIALNTLVNEHGVKMRKFSTFLLGALGEQASDILPVTAGKHPDSLKIYKHVVNFRDTMLDWSNHSERAIMEARLNARLKHAGQEG